MTFKRRVHDWLPVTIGVGIALLVGVMFWALLHLNDDADCIVTFPGAWAGKVYIPPVLHCSPKDDNDP